MKSTRFFRITIPCAAFSLLLCFSGNAQSIFTVTGTPGAAGAVPFAGASFDFVNPTNVDSNGKDYSSAMALASLLYGQSDYLEAKNFGFNVPANATVLGIQANIERDADGVDLLTSVTDDQVYLLRNGVITGTNQAQPGKWIGTEINQAYGSSSGLWGTSWSPAQVNSPTFGLALSVDLLGVAALIPTAKVYNVQMSITYSIPVTVLPIHLDDFALETVDDGIKIDWLDDDVDAGTSYLLERSSDLHLWIGIDSNSYNGEHMDVLSFSYTDNSPLPGKSYYRLTTTAVDGTKSQSDILLNDDETSVAKPEGYPNPAADNITLTGISAQTLKLFNAFGMEVKCPITVVQAGLRIDLESLPSGIYFAKSGRTSIRFAHR